jgi:ribosomal protein L22
MAQDDKKPDVEETTETAAAEVEESVTAESSPSGSDSVTESAGADSAADEADAPAEKPKRAPRRKPAAAKADADEAVADGDADAEEKPAAKPRARKPAAAKAEAAQPAAAAKPKAVAAEAVETAPVVRAQAKYVRTSARKARLVCDHIRGKSVDEARAILAFTPRAAAKDWAKLLNSAVANAENNHELLGSDLKVATVYADEGPTLKRFQPRAMGRATRIRKRTSHLTITLTPKG